ncbi:MAG TPA: hypothetical protein VF746_27530 [Longimicrobium sp.]|jgi:hypothetical protein
MDRPLLLYSASTWLAHAIAERFYGGIHYAWCSPHFDGTTAARHVNVPPTASPAEIYRNLADECRRGERHSDAIKRNRGGIMRGARMKREKGFITPARFAEIDQIVESAVTWEFRPVLYVIPFDRVSGIAFEVPVSERAHPLSVEYRVEVLPRGCFDIIEFRS